MRIIDTFPDHVISLQEYLEGIQDGNHYPNADLREMVGETLCTRLIVYRYGDHEHDYAGDFSVRLTSLKDVPASKFTQPGVVKVELELVEMTPKVKPAKLFVTPKGFLVSRSRIFKWPDEAGYFPFDEDGQDESDPDLVTATQLPDLALTR